MRRPLTVAITIALSGALLTGCLTTQTRTDPDPLAPGEQSRLDEPGRERAEALGHLRLDLSDLCLTVEETGFDYLNTGIMWFGDENSDMRLELIGPDGTLESTTRSVKVHTNLNRDSIDMVEWFVSEDTGAESRARLEADADMLGLSHDDLELWDLRVDGVRSGEDESHLWVIGLGVSPTGFVMDVSGSYNADTDNEVYIYAIYLDPAYNTPDAKASWSDWLAPRIVQDDDDWTC